MGSHLIFSQYNTIFGMMFWIPQHSQVFVSVIILTKDVEVHNKPLEDLCEAIDDKDVQVVKIGP